VSEIQPIFQKLRGEVKVGTSAVSVGVSLYFVVVAFGWAFGHK